MRLAKVSLVVVVALLAGCTIGPARRQAESLRDSAVKELAKAVPPGAEVKDVALQVTDDPWFGDSAVPLKRGKPLPITVETPQAVAVRTEVPMQIEEMAALLGEKADIPVRVTGMDLPTGLVKGTAAAKPRGCMLTMAYEGPLSGALNFISGQCGTSWKYDGTAIVIYRYETRTWVLETLAGKMTVADGLQGSNIGGVTVAGGAGSASPTSGGSAGGGGTTTTQSLKLDATVDTWTDIKGMLQTLLSGEGTFQVAPSTGAVTVIATPDRMASVAKYIEAENRRLSRQIAVTVELWDVEVTDSDQYGLDLNAVFTQARGLALGAALPPAGLTGTGALSVSVLNPPSWSSMTKWSGSNAAFNALSQVGRVGVLRREPIITLNNRTATRKITIDESYVAQSGGAYVTTGVATQPMIIPGVASEGIVAQLTPRVLDDGRILLQYSLQLSGKPTFRTASSGGVSIELPTQADNVFVGQAELKSGSTLVLAGSDSSNAEANGAGIGTPWNPVGGSISGTIGHTMIVVVITPVEIRVPDGSEAQ